MRQAQAQFLADAQLKMQEEQKLIAAEHAKTAEAHRLIFERSDAQNESYNKRFWWAAIVAIILALMPLLFPNGLPWVAKHLSRDEQFPIVVVLPTPNVPTTKESP